MVDESRKRQIANDCWKKATEAMAKENWDYAIDMFGKAVSLIRDNLMYRQSLRGVECKKYKNNKKGARMAFVKSTTIRGRIKKARMKNEWKAVDDAAEEGLRLNPWDAHFNAEMAEACKNMGYEEVAVFGYQRALETDPDNKEYLRALAELLERRGDYSAAISRWEKIQKLEPLSGEARSKISALRADSAIDRGGYQEAKGTGDVRKGYEERVGGDRKVPGAVEGPGQSLEADLQRAIRKDPANKDNYLKLADFYKREGRLDEAAEQFKLALDASGGDPNIREQLEDVELDQVRRNLDHAKEAAQKDAQNEEAARNYQALKRELLQREIEVLSRRVERYPADSKLKYELGQRFFQATKFSQAIPLFQQAVKDPRLQTPALVSLGKCFIQEKRDDLARRQFEKAIPNISYDERPAEFKETHYLLGRLYEKSNPESAENHYSEILAVDYDYRDVQARLERLQSGESTQAT